MSDETASETSQVSTVRLRGRFSRDSHGQSQGVSPRANPLTWEVSPVSRCLTTNLISVSPASVSIDTREMRHRMRNDPETAGTPTERSPMSWTTTLVLFLASYTVTGLWHYANALADRIAPL